MNAYQIKSFSQPTEIQKLIQKGYIFAHLDTNGNIIKGKKIFLNQIIIISTNDTTTLIFKKKPFNPNFPKKIISQKLQTLKNSGYPLADYKLDTAFITNNLITLIYRIRKGPKFYFDTLAVIPNNIISPQFLQNYLNIKPYTPYSQTKIQNISKLINSLPFLKLKDTIQLEFYPGLVKPVIYLKKQNSNQISANISIATNNYWQIYGFINLKLINSLKHAEQIAISWQKLQNQISTSSLSLSIPYILNSNLGFDLKTTLNKIDTSALSFQNSITPSFYFSALNYIGLNIITNYYLTPDTSTKLFGSGISLNLNSLNAKIFPTKGIQLQVNLNYGKTTNSNTSTYQLQTSLKFQYYQPITKRFNLRSFAYLNSIKASKLIQPQLILLTENQSIYYLPQNSLQVSAIYTFAMEPFILWKNLYLFSTLQYSVYENSLTNYKSKNYILTSGIKLHTKNYLISIYITTPLPSSTYYLKISVSNIF